jgi:hypothetical protein
VPRSTAPPATNYHQGHEPAAKGASKQCLRSPVNPEPVNPPNLARKLRVHGRQGGNLTRARAHRVLERRGVRRWCEESKALRLCRRETAYQKILLRIQS